MSLARRLIKKANNTVREAIGLPQTGYFQMKRKHATQRRWEMISGRIDRDRSRNLLDLGCDLGDLTALAAKQGLVALGVDSRRPVIQDARKRHRDLDGLAFTVMHISPDTIDALPTFDLCLCLSVHHHWHREYGAETAAGMLRTLLKQTNHALFFEPPSRQKRYGDSQPAFETNNEESVMTYHLGMLGDILGDAADIEYLGTSPCLGDREPFRCLFLITPRA